MTKKQIIKQVKQIVKAFYSEGGKIEINLGLPYVSILQPSGTEYFFQGEEACNLLDEVPDFLNTEEYIIWVSQGW